MPRRIKVPTAVPVGRAPLEADSKESVWARSRAAQLGGRAESATYLASVAAWRNAWRPEKVRVLLVAESHVAEEDGDVRVSVEPPTWAHRHLPTSFCRLVYCLGYGEPRLCTPEPVANATATWQFWDLFGAIAGGRQPMQPRKGSSPDAHADEHRLQWKLDVLSWLQRHGVWLVDACVAGIYLPGGERLASGSKYNKMVLESFVQFVLPSVSGEPLEQVWVIGSAVKKALAPVKEALPLMGIRVTGEINQPGDFERDRYLSGLGEMVNSLRKLVPPRP